MTRLFLYWDMSERAPIWAASVSDYRDKADLPEARAIRVASEGIAAPHGYTKTGTLANDAAVKGVARGKANPFRPNLYGEGIRILADAIEFCSNPGDTI